MRMTALLIALTLPLTTLPAGTAVAAPPPRVEGYDCTYLVSEIGVNSVWQAFFRGHRKDVLDHVQRVQVTACFHTEANCKAWLYWAQTDFPDVNYFRPCRIGIGY